MMSVKSALILIFIYSHVYAAQDNFLMEGVVKPSVVVSGHKHMVRPYEGCRLFISYDKKNWRPIKRNTKVTQSCNLKIVAM